MRAAREAQWPDGSRVGGRSALLIRISLLASPSRMVWRLNKYSQRCGSCAGEADPPLPDRPTCWTLHAERFQLPPSESSWMLDGAFKSLVVRNVKYHLSLYRLSTTEYKYLKCLKHKYIFKIFTVSNWTIRSPGSIIRNFELLTVLVWSFCVVCFLSPVFLHSDYSNFLQLCPSILIIWSYFLLFGSWLIFLESGSIGMFHLWLKLLISWL